GQAEAMPEAARREQDVVDPRRRRMSAQPRPIPVELAKVLLREPIERPERDVIGPGRVALGEHELVAGPEDVMMQDEEEVQARKVTADVADAALVMHPEQSSTRPEAQVKP